jgi:2-keto-4-pentenoate hydratase
MINKKQDGQSGARKIVYCRTRSPYPCQDRRFAQPPRATCSPTPCRLCCNGKLSQRGGGSLVLDSPLLALRHLVELLAEDLHNPPLQVGEIISTGTLTLAMPVRAGETWTTNVSGIPLDGPTLRFE